VGSLSQFFLHFLGKGSRLIEPGYAPSVDRTNAPRLSTIQRVEKLAVCNNCHF
jgi:hypothetical protein